MDTNDSMKLLGISTATLTSIRIWMEYVVTSPLRRVPEDIREEAERYVQKAKLIEDWFSFLTGPTDYFGVCPQCSHNLTINTEEEISLDNENVPMICEIGESPECFNGWLSVRDLAKEARNS